MGVSEPAGIVSANCDEQTAGVPHLRDSSIVARVGHPQEPSPTELLKNPANSHVKSSTTRNHHQKIHKQFKINHLKAKNKSAKTGILVSLNSLELKVDRKEKNKTRSKAGPSPLTAKSERGKSRLNPFPSETLHQKVPRGGRLVHFFPSTQRGPEHVAEATA
jgi:hypothetical protein